jgi:hypothetical protein
MYVIKRKIIKCGFRPPNLEKILESFFMSYNLPLFVYRHVHLARIYLQIHEKTVESLAFLFPIVLRRLFFAAQQRIAVT